MITLGVAEGSLLSKRDRRLETCRSMLRAFRTESWTKWALEQALPALVQDPTTRHRFGGDMDRVSEAQWMALLDVISQRG